MRVGVGEILQIERTFVERVDQIPAQGVIFGHVADDQRPPGARMQPRNFAGFRPTTEMGLIGFDQPVENHRVGPFEKAGKTERRVGIHHVKHLTIYRERLTNHATSQFVTLRLKVTQGLTGALPQIFALAYSMGERRNQTRQRF